METMSQKTIPLTSGMLFTAQTDELQTHVYSHQTLWEAMQQQKNRKQSLDQKGDSYLVIGFGLALPPPNSVMWWPCNVLWGSEIELSSHSPGKSHSRLTRKARWICPSHVTYDAVKIEKNWHYLLVGETRWITAHSACSYTMGCFSLRGWNTLAIRDGPRQRPWTLSVWYIGSLQISIGAQHEADVSALKIWSSLRHSLCLAPSPTKKLAHTQRQPASSSAWLSSRMRPPQAARRRVASGMATGIPVGRLTPYRVMYRLFSPTWDVSQLLTTLKCGLIANWRREGFFFFFLLQAYKDNKMDILISGSFNPLL